MEQVIPLKITLLQENPTIAQWRDELEKVYYQNTDTSDFTPGNRKLKLSLFMVTHTKSRNWSCKSYWKQKRCYGYTYILEQ